MNSCNKIVQRRYISNKHGPFDGIKYNIQYILLTICFNYVQYRIYFVPSNGLNLFEIYNEDLKKN